MYDCKCLYLLFDRMLFSFYLKSFEYFEEIRVKSFATATGWIATSEQVVDEIDNVSNINSPIAISVTDTKHWHWLGTPAKLVVDEVYCICNIYNGITVDITTFNR